MAKLTHLDNQGQARMVDVSEKDVTTRTAKAQGSLSMQPETLILIKESGHKKGDVLAVARIAAIQAAKKTPELIPLCHAIPLESVEVEFELDESSSSVNCQATAVTSAKTGVEMEALTAVEIALLTIYDMCKAVDRGMEIQHIHLVSKSGGRSGDWTREQQ